MVRSKIRSIVSAALLICLLVALGAGAESGRVDHLQGEMAGEVTSSSAVLQTRLTADRRESDRDVRGRAGTARFEISRDPGFTDPITTEWQEALPKHDFYVRDRIDGLDPDVEYFYRIDYGPDRDRVETGPARRFRTLPGAGISRKYTLAVVT